MQPTINYDELEKRVQSLGGESFLHDIVNEPFKDHGQMVLLGVGIIVLLIAGDDGMVHRVALSNTELAEGTKMLSAKRFEDIKVPLDDPENIISLAMRNGEPQSTTDWYYLFTPALTRQEAQFNQAGGAIATSYVYPCGFQNPKVALIYSYYVEKRYISSDAMDFMARFTQIVSNAIARQPQLLPKFV